MLVTTPTEEANVAQAVPADELFWGEEPYPTSDVDCPAVIFLIIAHARLGYLLFTA